MFKKLMLSLALLVNFGFGATIDDGYSAYKKGDYKVALTIFEDLALKGDAKAQYNLGVMYSIGQGVKQDYKKAI